MAYTRVKLRVVFLITAVLVCVYVLGVVVFNSDDVFSSSQHARSTCYENGYTEVLQADGVYYCSRLVDGNSEIVSVDALLGD